MNAPISDAEQLEGAFTAFEKMTRYASSIVVLDLADEFRQAGEALIPSESALRNIALFHAMGCAYAVVAGQLDDPDLGAFCVGVRHHGDMATLGEAVVEAAAKLQSLGETASMVGLMVDDELVGPLTELLAMLSASEGGAAS